MTARVAKWQHWLIFALGLWLAISPWALDHATSAAPTANAAIVGLVLALCSHFEVALDGRSTDWVHLVCGVWLVVAPFFLGLHDEAIAVGNSIGVGAAVTALAVSALSLDKRIVKWRHKRILRH